MNQLLLIIAIGGRRVALPAAVVQSLIEIETLTPVPRTPAHIAGLSALRSRILTVIDCRRSLDLPEAASPLGKREAVVIDHEGHSYALLVDKVVDVTEARSEPMPVQADLGRGWSRVSLGRVETDEGALQLVDVGSIISGPEELRAA